ncbi:sister chromatid cohesion protein PDS5 homolog B isoform X2 [Diospyros lotus]|uniref:sister chromatid cohesion protein PDS5 homolog B isoform X2 n=1 Tax=Diospyros lotus TaxID=55363 RepID=UPI0022566FE6|nr:sister chromatid cohesion protein PDS5 homolog B isoform X2 [Diospyros lotus]
MREADANAAQRLISDIGNQLGALKSRPNKDLLVKLLRQAASALPELDQLASLKPAIKPLSDSLVQHHLLEHKDKDIRLLVAICFCEIIRILAPNPDFTDSVFKDIFKLFLSLFVELADTKSPYFSRRLKVLETVNKLKFCVLMLDTGSEDLVLKMFNTFFNVVREHHPQSLFTAMSSIMALILKEKVSEPLIDVILQNLLKEGKGASPAASQLAVSVIENCEVELEHHVREFLISCILNRDAVRSILKEFYHEIIFEIFQCAPKMLLAVIPSLTQELLADQVDVRIKAVNLIGRLLALPGHRIVKEYHPLLIEFLKRFSDKSAEVRLSALSCAKVFYTTNPLGTKSLEVLTAVEGRLLDFDDRVRTQAVVVACDLAKANLKFVPPDLIYQAAERLRDKKVSVRKKALQKLLEIYRDYCSKCSGSSIKPIDHFEQIPCRVLMLCYDKDCKDFRPQNMELVLAEELFPVSLSIEEKTRQWILLFSLFNSSHLKVLNIILSQKRRLQAEMQVYLSLHKNEESFGSEEVQKRIQASVAKMSASFPDSSKAEESFHKLNLVKDNNIFTTLEQLLDEVAIKDTETKRDNFLRKIGDRHPHSGFLKLLTTKCLFNIFSSEHVHCILDGLLNANFGDDNLEDSSIKLLLTIICAFPSLLKGSEKKFQLLLLEGKIPFNEELIQMLAKEGPHIHIKLSDIYPSLERWCLEGTHSQSKLAISAIAALSGTPDQHIFPELLKTLVDALHCGHVERNIQTVLQSLGCIAQHSPSTFESQEQEISKYIVGKIFRSTDVEMLNNLDSFNDTSGNSISCKLKMIERKKRIGTHREGSRQLCISFENKYEIGNIFGLKVLVKSFLPHRTTHARHDVNHLLDLLSEMLEKGYVSDGRISREVDKAHIRLAAAKSVLRLSRRWDLHIPPHIFRLTILMAKASLSFIRRSFIDKTYKLLKQHAVPSKYACAFAFSASDSLNDLQEDSLKYMAEFIREYSRKFRICQAPNKQLGVTEHPAYIVVFLIHVLAHHSDFPPGDCEDEEIYSQFLSPLVFTLQALVNSSSVDGDMDFVNGAVSCLRSIFYAIMRAEDAVDVHKTPKLHILADFGISILNEFNHSAIPVSHTLRLILLPSSLYRISAAGKREECHFKAKIAKSVISSFQSQIFQSSSMFVKHGKKSEGDVSQTGIKKSALRKNDDSFINVTKEQSGIFVHGKETHETLNQENQTKQRKKRTLSPSPPGSLELHNEFFIYDEQEDGALGNSEPVIARNQPPSSCDSVTIKSSPSLQEGLKDSASLILNRTVRKSNVAGDHPSKFTRAAAFCSLKDGRSKSQKLVGKRIKLWSTVGECYYSGTVVGFDCGKDTHKISYDNGVVEVVSLKTENWKTISIDSLPEKEPNSSNSEHCDYVRDQSKMVDPSPDGVSQQGQFSNKRKGNILKKGIPLAGKENKGHKVSIDTSASEVINTNEESSGNA